MNKSDPPAFRTAYENAARFFLATAAAIAPDQWSRPSLGQWSVRDLVGHTSRALATVAIYGDQPAARVDVEVPAGYFLIMLHGSRTTAQEILERGRAAGADLGDDPVAAIRDLVDRILPRVAAMGDDDLLGTPAGGMRLREYLPTRTFELTVHTLDLAAAIGRPADPPDDALQLSLAIAGELAVGRGSGATLLQALTGRRDLPAGYSVV